MWVWVNHALVSTMFGLMGMHGGMIWAISELIQSGAKLEHSTRRSKTLWPFVLARSWEGGSNAANRYQVPRGSAAQGAGWHLLRTTGCVRIVGFWSNLISLLGLSICTSISCILGRVSTGSSNGRIRASRMASCSCCSWASDVNVHPTAKQSSAMGLRHLMRPALSGEMAARFPGRRSVSSPGWLNLGIV